MFLILLVSAAMAVVANTLHPRRIPWAEDWSYHVEAKARKRQIDVLPLSVALDYQRSGERSFVDARPAEEYEKGHIPTAVSLPFRQLDEKFEVLEGLLMAERPLVVYCSNRVCDDALMLAFELQDMGVSNLSLYVDGFDLWKSSGSPVATGAKDQ